MSQVGKLAKLPSGKRNKWIVLGVVLLAFFLAGGLASKLADITKNDTVEWLPGNAESTRAFLAANEFRNGDAIPTIVVYERTSGLTQADLAHVAANAAEFRQPAIEIADGTALGPIPSQDGQAAQVIVMLDIKDGGWVALPPAVEQIKEIAEEGLPEGLSVHVTGPGGVSADFATAFESIDGMLIVAALGVVIVLLLLTYRSPILWLLPLFSSVVALTFAMGVIYLAAKAFDLTVTDQTYSILAVLVIGASTDYALLLVASYREELRRHEDKHEAMAIALHRAGPAIFASAATVTVGMLCLSLADMNSTASLGPVLALAVASGVLVMLTLLPALLVIVGRRGFWPVHPDFGSHDHTATGIWAKLGSAIAKRPRFTWVATAAVLALAALTLSGANFGTPSNAESFVGDKPASITGEQIHAKHFPTSGDVPIEIVANAGAADAVIAAAKTVPTVTSAAVEGAPRNGKVFIKAVMVPAYDSPEAFTTVEQVRDAVHAVPNAEALVGGQTAIQLDWNRTGARDRNLIIPVVLILILMIISILLRAIVAPLILIATVVLSFLASLGIATVILQNIFDIPVMTQDMPLFAFVFLVALGVDYNIFLMTRVHEESKQWGTRRGALIGLAATGGVITSAGLVLAGTFAVLMTIPMAFVVQMGFLVALGVLIDTFIVRSILVTSLTLDIGRWMWWPSKLAQKPDVAESEYSLEKAIEESANR